MSSSTGLKRAFKNAARSLLPLSLRKHMAVWVDRQGWIGANRRYWWPLELVRDFAENDIDGYHKFLWANHLAYAATYEVEQRFGRENMNESRRMFFADLASLLSDVGIQPHRDVRSVFDVGCSLGYLLRHLETNMFTDATLLEGIDIDEYAIRQGTDYLQHAGSKIRLRCADMEELGLVMDDRVFDVIICAGVLMYLDRDSAAQVVNEMLKHTGKLLAISGLAHPEIDNSELQHSVTRESDRSFIHNIDSMVTEAGGRVIARRWEGDRIVDENTVYFVFASNDKT